MKKNLPLIIGLAIPVLMIIVVVIAVYVPNMFAHPTYGFVFSVGDYPYNYGKHYSVVNGVIVETNTPNPIVKTQNGVTYPENTTPVNLFVYDPITDNVRQITLADAQKLKVDISPKSPDGYVLDRGNNNVGIFEIFGSNRDYNAWYLRKGVVSKRIYLTALDNSYYYNNYSQFLGWIINGGVNSK